MTSREILQRMRANWPEVLSHRLASGLLAYRLHKLLSVRREPLLQQHDLIQAEFQLLFALRSEPPPHELQPTALYERLLVSSGGLTKLLKRLEDRSLVTRPVETGGDRRRRPVALSPAGVDLVERLMSELLSGVADRVDDAEFAAVERHLTDLLNRIEGAV